MGGDKVSTLLDPIVKTFTRWRRRLKRELDEIQVIPFLIGAILAYFIVLGPALIESLPKTVTIWMR